MVEFADIFNEVHEDHDLGANPRYPLMLIEWEDSAMSDFIALDKAVLDISSLAIRSKITNHKISSHMRRFSHLDLSSQKQKFPH
jgi:hypothetical protein